MVITENELENIISKSFITDYEKMKDFFSISKDEFLLSYSYLTEEEYDCTKFYFEWLLKHTK